MENDRIRPVCIHQNAFSILAPRMGSDVFLILKYHVIAFSILAPRMGSDPSNFVLHDLFLFQFSLPVWGATKSICTSKAPFYFSIHAPRMGSDIFCVSRKWRNKGFNSRSPHGERRISHNLKTKAANFQFSLPAWRATGEPIVDVSAFIFSILAPRMESDKEISCDFSGSFIFSIHAPRMESDGGRIFL